MIISDTVALGVIGVILAIVQGLSAYFLAKVNKKVDAVQTATDGINSVLRSDNTALKGEVRRQQDPNSGPTPETRADGGGTAPVTVDRLTHTVTVTKLQAPAEP